MRNWRVSNLVRNLLGMRGLNRREMKIRAFYRKNAADLGSWCPKYKHYVTSLQPKNARRWRADIWAIAFESLILP